MLVVQGQISQKDMSSVCLLVVLCSQGIVLKSTSAIFFFSVSWWIKQDEILWSDRACPYHTIQEWKFVRLRENEVLQPRIQGFPFVNWEANEVGDVDALVRRMSGIASELGLRLLMHRLCQYQLYVKDYPMFLVIIDKIKILYIETKMKGKWNQLYKIN